MLIVVFPTGIDEITVEGLTRWDTGQKIKINSSDLPGSFQVHFAESKRSKIAYVVEATSTNGVSTVAIPNIILQKTNAVAWIYIPSDDGYETTKTINLPIVDRAKPADYVYEEGEILYFEKVMRITEENARKAEEAAIECDAAREIVAEDKAEVEQKIASFESYNRNNYSNSLKANASGEVVRVDDVSPAQHNVKVKITGIDDPSSVTVTRCGKNLLDLRTNHSETIEGVTFVFDENGKCTINGTNKTNGWVNVYAKQTNNSFYIPKGATVTVSGVDSNNSICAIRMFTDTTIGNTIGGLQGDYYENTTITLTEKTLIKEVLIRVAPNATVNNVVIAPVVEIGTTSSGYEKSLGATSHTSNADGTLEIPSLAPTMTIFTDTEGANIDIEYNQDINVVAETTIRNVAFKNGATITLAHNTCFYASEPINNLTIIYPTGNFICGIDFTLASSGDITITLPESKYIGGTPSFANGETWELNIKNGVVIGGKVE